jgi:hypothetical protein
MLNEVFKVFSKNSFYAFNFIGKYIPEFGNPML